MARQVQRGLQLLCLALLSLAPGGALHAADASPESSTNQHRLVLLGAGDSINVQVYGQPDMTGTVYVGENGSISLPLVGSVPVAGLSPLDAASRVEKALRQKQLLVDPHVTISIVQSHGGRVSVMGEVRTPGRYAIDPDTTIFDILALAGGTTENAADVVYVLRQDAGGNVSRFPVDLKEMRGQGGAAPMRTLTSGDSLLVPRAAQFSIYGEVTAPNVYRIEPGMTVLRAIARAGGVTQRGSMRRIEVKRTGSKGSMTTTHVKLDDLVQPDDVIHVKESIF